MTRDDVTRWAREAGLPDPMVFAIGYERLVLRAAAVEREECAKVCDENAKRSERINNRLAHRFDAAAIRARKPA